VEIEVEAQMKLQDVLGVLEKFRQVSKVIHGNLMMFSPKPSSNVISNSLAISLHPEIFNLFISLQPSKG
jgi:hypothetical protein